MTSLNCCLFAALAFISLLQNLKLLVKILDKLDPKFDGADR